MSLLNGLGPPRDRSTPSISPPKPLRGTYQNGKITPAVTVPGSAMTATKTSYNRPQRLMARSISVPREARSPVLSFDDAVADVTKSKCLAELNCRKVSSECLDKPCLYLWSLSGEDRANKLSRGGFNSSVQCLSGGSRGHPDSGSDYENVPAKRQFSRQYSAPVLQHSSPTSSPVLLRNKPKRTLLGKEPQYVGAKQHFPPTARDRNAKFSEDLEFDMIQYDAEESVPRNVSLDRTPVRSTAAKIGMVEVPITDVKQSGGRTPKNGWLQEGDDSVTTIRESWEETKKLDDPGMNQKRQGPNDSTGGSKLGNGRRDLDAFPQTEYKFTVFAKAPAENKPLDTTDMGGSNGVAQVSSGTSFCVSGQAKREPVDLNTYQGQAGVTGRRETLPGRMEGPTYLNGNRNLEVGYLAGTHAETVVDAGSQQSNGDCLGRLSGVKLDVGNFSDIATTSVVGSSTANSADGHIRGSHLSCYENLESDWESDSDRGLPIQDQSRLLDLSNNNFSRTVSEPNTNSGTAYGGIDLTEGNGSIAVVTGPATEGDLNGNDAGVNSGGNTTGQSCNINRRRSGKTRLGRTDGTIYETKSETNLMTSSTLDKTRYRVLTPSLGRKPMAEIHETDIMDYFDDSDYSPPTPRKRSSTVGNMSLSPLRPPRWRTRKSSKDKNLNILSSERMSSSTDRLIAGKRNYSQDAPSAVSLSAQDLLQIKREQKNSESDEDDVFVKRKDLKTLFGFNNRVSPSTSPSINRRNTGSLLRNAQKSMSLEDCGRLRASRKNSSGISSRKQVNFSSELTIFDKEEEGTGESQLSFVKENESSPSWFRRFFSRNGSSSAEGTQFFVFDEEERSSSFKTTYSRLESPRKPRRLKLGSASPQRSVASRMRQLNDIAYLEVDEYEYRVKANMADKESDTGRPARGDAGSGRGVKTPGVAATVAGAASSGRSRTKIKTQLQKPSMSKQPFMSLRRMFSATVSSQKEPLLEMDGQVRRRSKSDGPQLTRNRGHYAVVGQCVDCGYKVRAMDLLSVSGNIFHASCFRGNR